MNVVEVDGMSGKENDTATTIATIVATTTTNTVTEVTATVRMIWAWMKAEEVADF
jgi:hypothetical protein